MGPHTFTPLRAALAATLLCAAFAAHAEMYRWVDESGSVTYSNQMPPDKAAVRDLTIVDDGSTRMSPQEKRTREILDAEREKSAQPATSQEIVVSPGSSPELPASAESGSRAAWTAQPEAVRDPCLRSADPKCYERNRDNYVPYRGYSPTTARALRQDPVMGVGASSSAAGGGMVGGGSSPASAPAKLTAPKASTYALPPGSDRPARR